MRVNPLESLTSPQIRSAIAAYRRRCGELSASAVALLRADAAQDEPLLDWCETSALTAIVEDDHLTRLDRENAGDLASLERYITLTRHLHFEVFLTLEEIGWETGSPEVEALALTPRERRAALAYYRAAGQALRLTLAQLIDAFEVADGRPSKADPLEWHSQGALGRLINDCRFIFDSETPTASLDAVETAIALKCRLEETLRAFGTGARGN